MKFNELIKREMKKQNVKQTHLALSAKVDSGNLSRILNGKTKDTPRIHTVIALFDELNIPLERLREIEV